MKRYIAFVLLICICVSMNGCSENETNETEPQTQVIELTTTNFNQYFFMESETRNYHKEETNVLGYKYATGYADCAVNIGQKSEGVLSNVQVKLRIKPYTVGFDAPTQEITIHIPVGGSVEKTVSFASEMTVSSVLSKPVFTVVLLEVSGTIEISV